MRPNLCAAFENRSKSCSSCATDLVCARSTQSSALRRSRRMTENTLVLAWRWCRLKTLPSVLNCIDTPRSQSLKATSSIMAKKMLNSCGASTQPCFVPCKMSKGENISPSSRTHPIETSFIGFQFVSGPSSRSASLFGTACCPCCSCCCPAPAAAVAAPLPQSSGCAFGFRVYL